MGKISFFLKKIAEKRSFLIFALAAAAFILFFNALFFDYTWLDDIDLVFFKNGDLRKMDLPGLMMRDFFLLPGKNAGYFYRPLALLPWVFAAKIAGASLWIYHLENIIFHILAGISFFALLEKLGSKRMEAFYASFLFLIVPPAYAIAGFVPNLSYPVLLLCLNLSFICGMAFLENNSRRYLLFHVFFFALGLFTLETALAFIPVFLFYSLFVLRKNKTAVLCCCYAALLLFWFFMRKNAVGGGLPENVFGVILGNIPSFFAPGVNFFLPFSVKPLAVSGYSAGMLFGLSAAAILSLIPFVSFRGNVFVRNPRIYALGAIIYLCFMLPPMLSGFEFNNMPHRGYISSSGLIIMLLEIKWNAIMPKKAFLMLFFMFLLLSAIASFRLGNFYSGGLVFWQRVLADNPGYKDAYYQIINIHQFQGDYDAAAEAAKKVLDLNPSDLQSNFLYAVHLSNAGKKDVAEKEFLKIINLSGGNPEYLSVYGKFLEELGRLPEAEKALKKAAESAPDYQKSRYNYGTFLLSQQKWKEAEIELRAALSAKKDILSVNIDEDSCRKKLAYVILRQAENAADNASMSAMAAEAVKNAPYPDVYEHSAYLLMDKKEYAAAEKMFVFALTGDPGRVSSAIGAGIAAAKAGNISKSEHYLLLALKIDPENEKAKEILEKIQKL